MKKEIEEIFSENLPDAFDYNEEKTISMTDQNNIIAEIISLIENFLTGEAPAITRTIQDNWGNNSDYMCNQIINIIKGRIKE